MTKPAAACAAILTIAAGALLLPALQAHLRQKSEGEQASRQMPLGTMPNGATLVPSNQQITPLGTLLMQERTRPKDMALSPGGGETLAVLTQNGAAFYQAADGKFLANITIGAAAPLGIAWSPDGQAVYASLAGGKIAKLTHGTTGTWQKSGEIMVDTVGAPGEPDVAAGLAGRGEKTGDPQVTGLAVSPNGTHLFVGLGIRNAVAVVDTQTEKVTRLVRVGVAPYHLVLSPDGKTLAVACRGGVLPQAGERSEPSAGTPVRVDMETDAAQSGAVAFISTQALDTPAKLMTVGRQPGGMAWTSDNETVYAASEDDDTLIVVSSASGKVTKTIALRPTPEFGAIPTSVAVSRDNKTLWVACGGANAVAVVDAQKGVVKGWIPTGWFPIAVKEQKGALFVASSKGLGNRVPRATSANAKTPAYNVHSTLGLVQVIPADLMRDLPALSLRVAQNNGWDKNEANQKPRKNQAPVPVPARMGEPSVFQHVVYIIKENHTYDDDLGDMKEGNGDPSLCLFGEAVTPNEHKIARDFVLLDNTYTSGTNSADGHQWSVSGLANGYLEHNYSAHARSYPYDGGDPLAYSPRGFLWNAVAKAKKSVRVYGEFVNRPRILHKATGKGGVTWNEAWADYQSGKNEIDIHSETDSIALRPYLHPRYIGFPLTVSDQWRAGEFIADVDAWEKSGVMPNLSLLLLPANHTSGTRPGTPTPRAAVSDNDLALGRIVERLSHSPFWKNTLILVIEDDSQMGLDHVDGHRTVAFCVSAYTRRHAVIHDNYNHTSFLRTIGLVLGLPAMNRFDQSATPLTACFTNTPDLAPYAAVRTNSTTLAELNPPANRLRGQAKILAQQSAVQDLTQLDRADASVLTRAAWSAQKPGVPFPALRYAPPADVDGDE